MAGGNESSITASGRSAATWIIASVSVVALLCALLVWPGTGRSEAARPGPSPTPTPTPTSPAVFIPPPTIPRDCSVSVTADLSAWLATVPDNVTIAFPANACYRIDETFIVRERTGLTFEGNDATFLAVTDGFEAIPPRTRSHWRLLHSTAIVIRDLTVDGPNTAGIYNPELEAQHGFEVGGGVEVTISNVRVREVYGDSVNVARGVGSRAAPLPPRESEDVLIEDSTLERIGRQGISITSARRVTVRGNTLIGASRSAIDIEPTSAINVIEDILIDSNVLEGFGAYMVAAGGACTATFADITIVSNDVVGGGPRIGNACPGRRNLLIESNRLLVPPSGGNQAVLIVNFTNATVRSNEVTVALSIPGVTFQAATGELLVELNEFCGASEVYTADSATGPVTADQNTLTCSPLL